MKPSGLCTWSVAGNFQLREGAQLAAGHCCQMACSKRTSFRPTKMPQLLLGQPCLSSDKQDHIICVTVVLRVLSWDLCLYIHMVRESLRLSSSGQELDETKGGRQKRSCHAPGHSAAWEIVFPIL